MNESKEKSRVLILIPAYNEEENIGTFLESMSCSQIAKKADILVIDDASKDSTADIAREHGVKVISQVYNMGYGAALQLGYKYATSHEYDYVLQLDADGQHDACNLDILYDCLTNSKKDCDIIIGSRFLEGSETYKMGAIRLLSIKFFRCIIKLIGHVDITDPTSGLQGLNRKAFSYYAQYGKFDYRYPDINMIMQMLLRGFQIGESRACMHQRVAGTSMHSGIWKPFAYMVLMSLSTIAAIIRNKE